MKAASIVAIIAGAVQFAALFAAAALDGTVWMKDEPVGLIENPGMFSIVLGDVALIILSTIASQMTRRMGRRLPSSSPALVRNYFKVRVDQYVFGRGGIFYKILAFSVLVGAMTVANQTVQMFNSKSYYGHATFADWGHIYSFVTVRIVLIFSWCGIVPLYFSYLLCHAIAIRSLVRRVERHGLARFHERHPDKSGGFSFFGWLDTLYALGILVVLIEIVLIMITHQRPTLGSVLAVCAMAGGALVISLFSVRETWGLVNRLGRKLKVRAYSRNLRSPTPADLDTTILNFGLNFSPYTATTLKLAVGVRALMTVPAAVHAFQYVSAAA